MTGASRTILLVDDDPSFLRDLRDLVRAFVPEATVVTAGSGNDALAILAKQPVDLLVSDHSMPGMEGIELLELARQRYPKVPRILITGYNKFDLAMDAVNQAHVVDFIPKPPNAERTIQAIRHGLLQREIETQD